ncbi:alkaline phosphatase family protein [Flavobacterium amnicola]|uniref:Alkaline phosphatase family protein n=1 Tax=Flavobacterium amnicola TaxID=2506422 RepID=A0A4Q1K1I3_9FLAO|nr:alkaline phosphatase family protein [Flavobacterium amnicola]RXR17294.1 alkaline phosphatase family protein [Flavobacterium amnicola]
MFKDFRIQEYKVLFYRIFLAYVFYSISRLFFFLYNYKSLKVDSVAQYLDLNYHGLAFDTTAILYLNGLFILLSVLPFVINTKANFQKVLMWIYFICNGIGLAFNFLDFIYYRFTYSRTTIAFMDIVENESNKSSLFIRFIGTYWHVFALFFITLGLWIYLYRKVTVENKNYENKPKYFGYSILGLLIIATMAIGGIRGDFKKSTRPITMIDASRNVTQPQHADIVLNTPFAILRTIGKNSIKKLNLVTDAEINQYLKPIKHYTINPPTKPNIVVIITESYGREYLGAFNKDLKIENYKSYTPFLDSLAQSSMIYTNAYANGSKSIHGMSSVIAGVPSFRDAFTSSPYSKQKIESLVSCLNDLNYDTSFFHGAANGSMGFLGLSNILGYDHYYGRTEFNNDNEFDGSWGIWDEPFLQFMKQELDKKKGPFFSTIFTVSSHEPFLPPAKYASKFPKGDIPMHQVVGYTDYAFKKFFESAKKAPWFKNTIFIITADHCNQVYYPFYNQVVNRQAVPIMIYKPDGSLKGVNNDFAQQIDIYPTILDMIGYHKPFRSWGRSLFNEKEIAPFAFNFNGGLYQFMQGNYICLCDGKNVTAVYDKSDFGLEKNIISKVSKEDFVKLEKGAKSFLQDYMNRIVDKKMYTK